MRTASSNMTAHLAGEVTSLAVCWKLTLVGGTVMGFTDHTSDLTVSSQLYKAATGFSPTSVETKISSASITLTWQESLTRRQSPKPTSWQANTTSPKLKSSW